MFIVQLEDGTTYNIDTDSSFNAKRIVEYKLRNRLDFRKVESVTQIKGVVGDKNNKYYNSGNQFDGKELKATSGWDYKWI